ncbi:hydroxypyruvate isomerase [Kribbella italica]|uniref:Hydroxypyruvate isomerase n=1 Tax=Kribbella italica TaxID=1540520 RepID=A0A7W9J638_9ACTN|nr:hydroxypyruvate isomerase [Kribbella italica]
MARAGASLFAGDFRGFEVSANVSMLFTELPYLDRYAAASRRGFHLVESWWPFPGPTASPA